MTALTQTDLNRIADLAEIIRTARANAKQVGEFLQLIDKAGQYGLAQNAINQAGFASIIDLQQHLEQKKSQEALGVIVAIGIGVLAAYAGSNKFR